MNVIVSPVLIEQLISSKLITVHSIVTSEPLVLVIINVSGVPVDTALPLISIPKLSAVVVTVTC